MIAMGDLDAYWQLVADARADRPDGIAAGTVTALRTRPAEEILALHHAARTLMASSYRWSLWHAAYQINGGCSDDGFDYFRGWLLSQGRDVFERAVADPDSLADVPDVRHAIAKGGGLENEDMQGATTTAYKLVTGDYPPRTGIGMPALGPGWDFEDDDEFATRLPRLCELIAAETSVRGTT